MFAAERLSLPLKASPGLAGVLGLAHGIGAAVPWFLGIPGWLALPASLALVGLGSHAILRDALRRLPDSVVRIELRADGTGQVELRSGSSAPIRLGRDAVVWSGIVMMRAMTDAGRPRGLVLTRASCGVEPFRRLKVFLRWRLGFDSSPRSGPVDDGPRP